MNDISMNSPADFMDITPLSNRTLPFLLQWHHSWILGLFLLSLCGIVLTIILFLLYLYFSIRRLNDHLILPNLFLCFSVCFLYLIVLFFLFRGNEIFCGLREFLSQFAYALLFSALLCRYIMQWLSTRILSKRTQQLTSLLIYFLLICTQIPIGILWWYFTKPRVCSSRTRNEYPKFEFQFSKRVFNQRGCSYQCIVDYRFYTTYTYIIFELVLCTIIAMGLFCYRCCHRNGNGKEQLIKTNNHHKLSTFLNMVGFILIDLTWIVWTSIYYFTHSSFVYPSLVIGMFTIGSITLFLILLPQLYFYSNNSINEMSVPKITLFTNQLALTDDMKDEDLLLHEKQTDRNQQRNLSNGSEVSYELGTSGTFLPITRTPKGPFKVLNTEKKTAAEKLDQLVDEAQKKPTPVSDQSTKNQREAQTPVVDTAQQQPQSSIAPLQRQVYMLTFFLSKEN